MNNLQTALLPDPVPDHPLLRGRKEIGRGESTIVLEADTVNGEERVFKVLSSPTDYAYYTADDRPTGRHFPIVYADHGTAGRSSRGFPFHIVEVERLYPLQAAPRVTSIHHQAVKQLGASLHVEAKSSDDAIVEAIRWDGTGFVYGVQWHPEFHPAGTQDLLDSAPLLGEFLRQAARRAER